MQRIGAVESGAGMELIHEVIFQIKVNGRNAGSVSATPQDLRELAAGWLLTEGYIETISQVEEIKILEEERLVKVSVSEDDPGETTCASTGGDQRKRTREKVSWTGADLAQVHTAFEHEPPLFTQTHASHSCMVVHRNEAMAAPTAETEGEKADPQSVEQTVEVLYRSEDAGRHSALDKAIGWALLHDVDLSECMLFGSGRISTRMAAKAGRAGVSALAGPGTVTAEAVELAKEYDMSLIGNVRADSAFWFHETPEGAADSAVWFHGTPEGAAGGTSDGDADGDADGNLETVSRENSV